MNTAYKSKATDLFWNLMTFFTFGALLLVFAIVAVIYLNPNSFLNPFPPSSDPSVAVLGPQIPPPTATLPVLLEAKPEAVLPTDLPTPTAPAQLVTVTVIQEETVVAPTPTRASSGYAFTLKSDIVALDGKIFHPEWECSWLGAAGQVEDLQGRPAKGIRVQVGGWIDGKTVDINSLTGTATQYGPSGFEFRLAERPVNSTEKLWIQLLDQAGLPLSGRISFNTTEECDKNLVLINFKQVR